MRDPKKLERWSLGDELLQVAKADTAFADLYLQRARELLSSELSEAQYAVLEGFEEEVADLTNRIEAAMAEGDWSAVRELTGRATELKRTLAEQGSIRAIAARVYEFADVLVDPFSPGLCGLAGVAERDLPALRDGAARRLERLCTNDPAWAELYADRLEALRRLRFAASPSAAGDVGVTVEALQARAQAALVQGDLAQLRRLSEQLLQAQASAAGTDPGGSARASLAAPVLTRPFPGGIGERAGKLGLAPRRVASMAEEVVARFRPTWRATLGDPSGNTLRVALTVPGDTDEALRDAAGMFMSCAFVSSAGTRYIPWMVEEDLLVEEFADPIPGVETVPSPLLAALGLPRRRALSRNGVERALRARGAAVVKDLGLDPREYRVVCVPADVHTRLGVELGWGKAELWTHFDGYMASKERKLMALVGGDARFGGLHDFVAVGADYDSDRLFARFAVVQRRRFSMW